MRLLVVAAAAALAGMAGCTSPPCEGAGEGHIPTGLCSRPDSFAFGQHFDGRPVDLRLLWPTTKPVAALWGDPDSSVTHGGLTLEVRDAEGDLVYQRTGSLFHAGGLFRTQPGTPGQWTFVLHSGGEGVRGPFGFYAEAQATT